MVIQSHWYSGTNSLSSELKVSEVGYSWQKWHGRVKDLEQGSNSIWETLKNDSTPVKPQRILENDMKYGKSGKPKPSASFQRTEAM